MPTRRLRVAGEVRRHGNRRRDRQRREGRYPRRYGGSRRRESLDIAQGAVTYDELEQLVAQMVAYHGDYMVIGETVFIPSAKGAFSGEDVTFYSASYNEETGAIALT